MGPPMLRYVLKLPSGDFVRLPRARWLAWAEGRQREPELADRHVGLATVCVVEAVTGRVVSELVTEQRVVDPRGSIIDAPVDAWTPGPDELDSIEAVAIGELNSERALARRSQHDFDPA